MGCRSSRVPAYEGPTAVKIVVDDILLSTCTLNNGFACGAASGQIYTYLKPYGACDCIQPWEHTHKRGVNALATCGTSVLSAGGDGKVHVWSAETQKPAASLAHDLSVTGVDFLSSEQAASGSRDGVVKVWDLEATQEIASSHISRNVCTAIRTWDRGFVQTSEDLQFRYWSPNAEVVTSAYSGPNQLVCVDVHDNYAIAGSKGFSRENCCIHLVDIRKDLHNVMEPVPAFDHAINGIRIAEDGRGVAVCKDGTYREFTLHGGVLSLDDVKNSGQLLQSVSLGHGVKFMAGDSKVHVTAQ
eukprot:GEMP01066254.1.p1 GENE.GEMP01066254.1~~GEMP01066254.1.p1  ORF type:complete len:300 (+),score=50.65 GEMP01066254.1:150-1049(+)